MKNIRNRRKSKKQRNKFTVDRNQWRSCWCKTVLEKSVEEPNGRKHSTAGMVTWVKFGAGQTREAKEIAMRVMVIRIMMDEMMIITKATFILYLSYNITVILNKSPICSNNVNTF